jgi:hypothetical protein
VEQKSQNTDPWWSDRTLWIARQIFTAYPEDCTGLKFSILDCGCIYYQRVFTDGEIDPQFGIYRDASDGPCMVCMQQETRWKERVVDEVVVYSSRFIIQS